LGYIDVQFLAPRIRGEVYNKIIAPKSVVIYPDFGHEGLPGHSEIVFQFLRQLK